MISGIRYFTPSNIVTRRPLYYCINLLFAHTWSIAVRSGTLPCNIWPPVLKKFKEGLQSLFTGLMKFPTKNGSGDWTFPPSSSEGTEDIITAFKICKFYPDLKYIFSFKPREGLLGHDFCFQKERSRSRLFKNSLPNRLFATWNGLPPQFAQIPNLNGLKRFLDDRYVLARYTCRLPRSGLGPGVDGGLTEFGGAGCVTGVST